ncbi:MAG: hypothetical protein WA584_13405 [Pyrinomonadaceae bacterium]
MPDDKRGDELTDYHNDGQSDYNDGKYEPPHTIGILDTLVYSSNDIETWSEDNKAYDSGYSNARDNK